MILYDVFYLVATYLSIGAVFSILFVTSGVKHIDQAAQHTGPGFRILIVPGAFLFWPLLARKWVKVLKRSNDE